SGGRRHHALPGAERADDDLRRPPRTGAARRPAAAPTSGTGRHGVALDASSAPARPVAGVEQPYLKSIGRLSSSTENPAGSSPVKCSGGDALTMRSSSACPAAVTLTRR